MSARWWLTYRVAVDVPVRFRKSKGRCQSKDRPCSWSHAKRPSNITFHQHASVSAALIGTVIGMFVHGRRFEEPTKLARFRAGPRSGPELKRRAHFESRFACIFFVCWLIAPILARLRGVRARIEMLARMPVSGVRPGPGRVAFASLSRL